MTILRGDFRGDGSVAAALQCVKQQLRQDLQELWLRLFVQRVPTGAVAIKEQALCRWFPIIHEGSS